MRNSSKTFIRWRQPMDHADHDELPPVSILSDRSRGKDPQSSLGSSVGKPVAIHRKGNLCFAHWAFILALPDWPWSSLLAHHCCRHRARRAIWRVPLPPQLHASLAHHTCLAHRAHGRTVRPVSTAVRETSYFYYVCSRDHKISAAIFLASARVAEPA